MCYDCGQVGHKRGEGKCRWVSTNYVGEGGPKENMETGPNGEAPKVVDQRQVMVDEIWTLGQVEVVESRPRIPLHNRYGALEDGEDEDMCGECMAEGITEEQERWYQEVMRRGAESRRRELEKEKECQEGGCRCEYKEESRKLPEEA